MTRYRITFDIEYDTVTPHAVASQLGLSGLPLSTLKVVELPPPRKYKTGAMAKTLTAFKRYDAALAAGLTPEQAAGEAYDGPLASFARIAMRNGRADIGNPIARIDYANRKAGR